MTNAGRVAGLCFLAALAYFGAIHMSESRLADCDGYFHIRYASLGPSEWLGRDFRWMPFSVFQDHHWVDHQLLFHALLWPFTKVFNLLDAAHAAAAVFAAMAIGAFGWLLTRRGIGHGVLWSTVLLGGSRFFVDRMVMPRTQSLSLVWLCLGLGLALEGRLLGVLIVGALFAWTYHVSAALIPLCAVASWVRRDIRPLLASVGGVVLGLLAHPQSPYTFWFFYLHAIKKVLNRTGQAVGAEWTPMGTDVWLGHWAPVAALAGLALLRSRTASRETRGLAVVATGLFVASTSAVKWLEYAVPFGVLAVASLWRDNRWRAWPLWVFVLGLWPVASDVLGHIRSTVPPGSRLAGLASHLPAEDCAVFQADWTDFSELFFHAPQCTYTVGLDPHFLSEADPGRANLVEEAYAGRVMEMGRMAREVFGAGWIVTTSGATAERAAADPMLERVYTDGGASLWRVR